MFRPATVFRAFALMAAGATATAAATPSAQAGPGAAPGAATVVAPPHAARFVGESAPVPVTVRMGVSTSSTTTTTLVVVVTSTTLENPRDIGAGGRFQGGFGSGGSDLWFFDFSGPPAVLVLETSGGADDCSGDTTMELRRGGVPIAFDDQSGPGSCSRIVLRLDTPATYDVVVTGYQGSPVPYYILDVEFVETECGNDVVELLEECDDGNLDEDDCCLSDCTKAVDDSSCDDGLLCNGTDLCLDGACVVHTLNPCPGVDFDSNCAESCSDDEPGCAHPDPEASPCDDGLFCNGPDRCVQGNCIDHRGDPCRGPDGDGDCTESCKESLDTCSAADPGGTPCDDTLFCTGADTCFGGLCTQHAGDPCVGADGDGNCRESCNENADKCNAADPDGAECTDGLFCTGEDSCQDGLCALHSGSSCDGPDGDGDCAESCNEAADDCSALDQNGSSCSNGVFCDGPDFCQSGVCSEHLGDPCPAEDGDGDCAETCDEVADACTGDDMDGSPCDDGVFCNGADTCQDGTCSQHTGNPCTGSDGDGNCAESCDELVDTCAGPDPNGSACNDGVFCNGTDTCQGGACSAHAGDPCPGPDGDGNCSESCDEVGDTCTAPDAPGAACTDGVFCNGADSCEDGECSGHAGDPCPGPDGDGNCSESCNEAADACTAADPESSACSDGLFCNGLDSCLAGSCSVHGGDPCPGSDGDGDCSETCSESADACTAADPNGSPCSDGLYCNGTDSCAGGVCSTHAGDPCAGVDGDADCAESCDESADDCAATDPDDSPCDDGLFCNGADQCLAGTCDQHAGDPCAGPDGDGDCSETCDEILDDCSAADPDATPCDDGAFCNGLDTCVGGSCLQHSGDPCAGADGDGDCSESCDEDGDDCLGPDPDESACDDGLFCNGLDLCAGGACTVHEGADCPGADGDGDCAESCSDEAEGCTGNDPAGTPCDDGIFCNGPDRCSGGTCSVHLGNPCAGPDGDGNCSESCDEDAGACTAPDSDASACDDGSFCNGADQCSGGACVVHAGDPCPGADGDGDCSETCNEDADACDAADADSAACDDGLFCNGTDQCSGGNCADHTGDPCPGADGDGNCSESCDEDADACSAADPDGSDCDDGLFCSGADQCSGGSCSGQAGDPCPGADGDGDCSETCDEAADACTAPDADEAPCDDGMFCNGDDACSGGSCSLHEGDPCAGPNGDGDCSESCDEDANACGAADPDGSSCDDDVFCNGPDRCAAGECVEHGGDPCPGPDGDSDCVETCNESAAACTTLDPVESPCSDGDACSIGDSCDQTGTCVGGEPLDCDDLDPCTVDVCLAAEPWCSYEAVPNCPPSTTTTLPLPPCGDVNGGGVSAGDALAVLKAAVGGPQCDALPCICDVNGGGVGASDALLVLRYAVGSLETLDCNC